MGAVRGVVGGAGGPLICGFGGWHALRPPVSVSTHAEGVQSFTQPLTALCDAVSLHEARLRKRLSKNSEGSADDCHNSE